MPHFFSAADGDLLALTTQYHDRMPCMLLRQDFEAWLDGSGGMELLKQPPRELREWIVSKRVNSSRAPDDAPTLVDPVEPEAEKPSEPPPKPPAQGGPF